MLLMVSHGRGCLAMSVLTWFNIVRLEVQNMWNFLIVFHLDCLLVGFQY